MGMVEEWNGNGGRVEWIFFQMVVCAGSLTITFHPTSGQRSYLNLENFDEAVGDAKLQTLSS